MIDLATQLGFTGNFEMSIDSKGRVTVPAPFVKVQQAVHAAEGGMFVVSVSLERNIAVFPVAAWLRTVENLEQFPALDIHSRKLRTMMTGYSYQVSLDANKRLRLPVQLTELCGIEKEVTFVGQRDHFQIWDRQQWADFSKETIEHMLESAQEALAR